MPVTSRHPSYQKLLPVWARILDCLEGSDAVKAAGPTYLPRLSDQENEAYNAYVTRAVYFNAPSRTHEAMIGFLFRKPPHFEEPPATLEPLFADADLDNNPLISYARIVAKTVSSTGHAGTLIDWSEEEERPYFAFYPEMSIINWTTQRISGVKRLTMLVLLETEILPSGTDPYEADIDLIYREFRRVEGAVEVRIWREKQTKTGTNTQNAPGTGSGPNAATPEQVGKTRYLARKGQNVTEIPFVFHGCETNNATVDKPPLADITAVAISHYQNSADLENGRHIAGIPTPYAFGLGDDGSELYLGSASAWTSDNHEAKVGFLEFQGQGLEALEKALQEKQAQMAALGARLIEPKSSDAEAYDTVQLRASAETSTLARIAMLLTESISRALQLAEWWTSTALETPKEISFQVNTDFTSAGIRPEMLTALTGAYQQGAISREAYFYQLERGEMFPSGWTNEQEWSSLEENPPMPPPAPEPAGGKPPPTK